MKIAGVNLQRELGKENLILSDVFFKREESQVAQYTTIGKLFFTWNNQEEFAYVAQIREPDWFLIIVTNSDISDSVLPILKELWENSYRVALAKTRISSSLSEYNYYSFSSCELRFKSNLGGNDGSLEGDETEEYPKSNRTW